MPAGWPSVYSRKVVDSSDTALRGNRRRRVRFDVQQLASGASPGAARAAMRRGVRDTRRPVGNDTTNGQGRTHAGTAPSDSKLLASTESGHESNRYFQMTARIERQHAPPAASRPVRVQVQHRDADACRRKTVAAASFDACRQSPCDMRQLHVRPVDFSAKAVMIRKIGYPGNRYHGHLPSSRYCIATFVADPWRRHPHASRHAIRLTNRSAVRVDPALPACFNQRARSSLPAPHTPVRLEPRA